jgi:hypothetical protein
MTVTDAVRLGRVSNLPTVWTNALAGTVLAGGSAADLRFPLLLLAISLAYVGGMYLNDAFDAEIDRRERPRRPIPSGRARRSSVIVAGSAMLAGSVLILAWLGLALEGGTGLWPVLAGLALAAAIVAYNWHHKGNRFGPVVMGLCRGLVYLAAGLVFTAALPSAVWLGAVLLLAYIVGLTYLAKQENFGRVGNFWPLLFLAAPIIFGLWSALVESAAWPFLILHAALVGLAVWLAMRRRPGDIGRAVVLLIAGISLFDALMIGAAGMPGLALLAAAGFVLTLGLQRFVSGT